MLQYLRKRLASVCSRVSFSSRAPNKPACRSANLDAWTQQQLKTMTVGGNARGRAFFKDHGWEELGADKPYHTLSVKLVSYVGLLQIPAAGRREAEWLLVAAVPVQGGRDVQGAAGEGRGKAH